MNSTSTAVIDVIEGIPRDWTKDDITKTTGTAMIIVGVIMGLLAIWMNNHFYRVACNYGPNYERMYGY